MIPNVYGGVADVLRLKVPEAYRHRKPVQVPWLMTCAWLCYQSDPLMSSASLNQQCGRYVAEHDPFVFNPQAEWQPPAPQAALEGNWRAKGRARRRDYRRV